MWESTEMSFIQEWEHHHTTFMKNDSTLLAFIISCILVIYSYLKHDIIFKKSLYVEGVAVNQQDANFAEVISYTGSLQVNHTLHAYTLVSSPPLNLKENYDLALAKGIWQMLYCASSGSDSLWVHSSGNLKPSHKMFSLRSAHRQTMWRSHQERSPVITGRRLQLP